MNSEDYKTYEDTMKVYIESYEKAMKLMKTGGTEYVKALEEQTRAKDIMRKLEEKYTKK